MTAFQSHKTYYILFWKKIKTHYSWQIPSLWNCLFISCMIIMFSNMLSWFLQSTLIFTLSEKFVRLINMCQELRFFFRNWLLYLLLHSDCSTIITSSTCVKKLPWQIYHLVTIDVNNILKVKNSNGFRFLLGK